MKYLGIFILLLLVACKSKTKIDSSQLNPSYTNVYLEPYTIVNLDTNKFEIKQVFKTGVLKTEAMELGKKKQKDVFVVISSLHEFEAKPAELHENFVQFKLQEFKTYKNDTLEILKYASLMTDGFIGYWVLTKNSNKPLGYALNISCIDFKEKSLTDFQWFSSLKDSTDVAINSVLNEAKSLMKGITSISPKLLEEEQKILAAKYTISVDSLPLDSIYYTWVSGAGKKQVMHSTKIVNQVPAELISHPFFGKYTFYGMLKVQPALQEEAMALGLVEKFSGFVPVPIVQGRLGFTSRDQTKGLINKRGYLVVKNKYGFGSKIPFDMEYYN